MFIFSQSGGWLGRSTSSGGFTLISSQCYAGHGPGKNSPAMQDVPNVGPLPQGLYNIGLPYTDPEKGPNTMRLTPAPLNVMFGRSGFLIHADMADPALAGTASEGCLVVQHDPRATVASFVTAGDNTLVVVP